MGAKEKAKQRRVHGKSVHGRRRPEKASRRDAI